MNETGKVETVLRFQESISEENEPEIYREYLRLQQEEGFTGKQAKKILRQHRNAAYRDVLRRAGDLKK